MAYYYSNHGGTATGNGAYKDDGGRYYGQETVAMPASSSVSREKNRWNWCATVWASMALFLCPWCFLCNYISVTCLAHAYADHKSMDYERKKYKMNCGIGWLVTSWVLGAIAVVLVIVLFYLTFTAVIDLQVFADLLRQLNYPPSSK